MTAVGGINFAKKEHQRKKRGEINSFKKLPYNEMALEIFNFFNDFLEIPAAV